MTPEEQIRYYYDKALAGDPIAQYNVAQLILERRGSSHDGRDALEWYLRSAKNGFSHAQHALGVIYREGLLGEKKNLSECVRWLRAAAEQGHPAAQNSFGQRYRMGEGVGRDVNQAIVWFRRAAEQGDTDAEFNLYIMYSEEEGPHQDKDIAHEWLRRAYDHGNSAARRMLDEGIFRAAASKNEFQDYVNREKP